MQYRTNPKNGDRLSLLGFGCMRLPRDDKAARQLLEHAIANGVNYLDTAYIYPGNEAMLGRILTKELRDKVNLATKLPPYLVRKQADFDKLFAKQLQRLATDRVEYYLIHMLPNTREFARLCALGLLDWAAEKKRSGQIGNLGFSYHGGVEEFKGLVDAHSWDFCMLQFNYVDEQQQAGKTGVQYAAGRGVPVFVMEPLRGGSLANKIPPTVKQVWDAAGPKHTPAWRSFRWLFAHEEVLCVLSGMNTMPMLQENLQTAETADASPLSQQELALYQAAREAFFAKTPVPCTGCNYCMPCPFGVDIPMCFTLRNEYAQRGFFNAQSNYILRVRRAAASNCTQCGKCETHCPQGIAIREELAGVRKKLEGPLYRPMRFVMETFMQTRGKKD